jgi:sec-independent protein translocase protein TatB
MAAADCLAGGDGVFDSVGWGEILVLILAGLFILGPDRLPEAAAWLGRSVRKVREFREEVGPEFDEWRQPLRELQRLRGMDPRRAVSQHLFDGDSDPLGVGNLGNGSGGANGSAGANGSYGAAAGGAAGAAGPTPEPKESLQRGEKPPVDPDAT